MKKIVTILCAVAILALVTTLVGCTSATDAEKASEAYEARFGEPAESKLDGDPVDPVKEGEMPDSHQMMAMMILEGAGENSDLSSYKSVTLVPMWTPEGTEFNAVVLDEDQVVFPASISGGK